MEKVAARLQQLPQGVWLRVDKKSAEEKRSVMRALSMTDDDFLRMSALLYEKGSDRILTLSALRKSFFEGFWVNIVRVRNNTGFYEVWLIVLDAEPSDFLNLPEPYADV